MEKIELKAELREKTGSGDSGRMRTLGFIPAVLYGKNEKPSNLKISLANFHKVLTKGENVIITLSVGGKEKMVMIKDIQRDPVGEEIDHADFLIVSLQDKVTVKIPIELVGEPIGVKEKGGVLEQVLRELEVKCLPSDIPAKISLDVSKLDIGHSFTVGLLDIDKKIEVLNDSNSPVAAVIAATTYEEEKKVEEVATTAEPELIKKPKKEGEEEAEEEAPKADAKKEDQGKSGKEEKGNKK